jgi:drug/metabolite transporter (DMT)-like permease
LGDATGLEQEIRGRTVGSHTLTVPATALLLALSAAFLHALWNLLLAGARDGQAAGAVMLFVSAAVFAPVAAVTWNVQSSAVPYLVGSATFQLAYFALLVAAYRRAELSLIYPIARGLAPVIVLVVTALALAVRPTALESLGVIIVGVGVVLVRGVRHGDSRGVLFSCAIAACIAGYTIIDKEGIRYADPVSYFEIVNLVVALVFGSVVARRVGFRGLRAELGARSVVAGLAGFVAYVLVLAALERAPAAAVAAVRETSVVIATVLAAVVLSERVDGTRLVGATAVVIGVALIALA